MVITAYRGILIIMIQLRTLCLLVDILYIFLENLQSSVQKLIGTNLKTQGLLETSTSLSTIFWQHAVCVPVDAVLLFSTVTMVVGTQILRVNIVATPTIYTVKLGFSLNSLLVVSLFLAITCYVYKVINPRYRDISCIFFYRDISCIFF